MFGHKEKEAIAALPPLHRTLVEQGTLAASLPTSQWDELITSLGHHADSVHKHPLPPRAMAVVVPLLRILEQDVDRDKYIGVNADLRGPDAPGKKHPKHEVPPRPPVTHAVETLTVDPWLAVSADLSNKASIELTVLDVHRELKLRKRGSSGKIKFKTKNKGMHRIQAKLTLPAGVRAVPPRSASGWCRVQVRSGESRDVITSKAKATFQPDPGLQLRTILIVLAETFRSMPRQASPGEGAA